jgi:flavodoxin
MLVLVVVVLAGWFVWSAYQVPRQRAARTFPPAARYDLGKALVVYYSSTGNTAEAARRIRAMTNGSLLEIKTREPYPAAPMLFVRAKLDQKSGKYPALETALPDFAAYDVIFVGSPVWWYSIAPPILSLLSQSDFGGKTVIPFCTHGGNTGDFFQRFGREARNAKLMEGIDFSGVSKTTPSDLDHRISSWLSEVREVLERRPADD